MIRYTSVNQIEIFEFEHPFETELDSRNRWVKLSKLLPWDRLVGIYSRSLSADTGRYGIDGRLAVGALIIKHKMKLTDREVIETIKENIYLQHFVGFKKFTTQAAFDPSLFVELRKRMGADKFDEMNQEIISLSEKEKEKKNKPSQKDKDKPKYNQGESKTLPKEGSQATANNNQSNEKVQEQEQNQSKPNKGKLKIDATVADQMIVYPTDLGLLNRAREESERLIDILYEKSGLKKKPRTYRRVARKQYLAVSKKKQKSKKLIRKAIGKQLRYLRRNIKTIHMLLDMFEYRKFPLIKRDQKIFWVIQLLYDQQEEMYREKKHSVKDRIVNIYQPYVRPIPRGKDKASVEFGSKLGLSEVDGFTRLNHLSWDAYNESTDLKQQVEEYYKLYGFYPEVVLADGIYLTRENRKYLKELSIRITGKPLGRPMANESYYQKAKRKKEHNQRNHVEGKIGQGKNAYGLKQIRARTKETSESWIANIIFVMNIVKLEQLFLTLLILIGTVMSYYFSLFLFIKRKMSALGLELKHIKKKIAEKTLCQQIIKFTRSSNQIKWLAG